MPNRIIREAILSSEKIASLGWPEEVFYRRLMSIVDDYGRTEANPQLLRARCYPLQTDQVRVTDIARWMAACQKSSLILCYADGSKQYLEVSNFQQQQRSPSKYPAPPASANGCAQMIADAHLGVSVVEDVSVVEVGKTRKRATPEQTRPDDVSEQVWTDWLELRKGKRAAVTATVVDEARAEAVKASLSLEAFLRVWCARGSQGLQAEWLKNHERGEGMTFRERDAANATARIHEMTGGLVSAKPITRRNDALQEVFDATPRLTA